MALSFGLRAHAEPPRQELAHAYGLLKLAKSVYHGHKGEAMKQIEAASHELGFKLEFHGSERESQLKSDEQLAEASRLVREARDQMEARDRDRIATHLEKAVEQLDLALKTK